MALNDLGEAFVKIRPDFSRFGGELATNLRNSVTQPLAELGDVMERTGGELLRKFAIPLGVAIAANITQFQALDAKIRETLTLFGSGGTSVVTAQFDEMQEGIRDVSREVGVLEQNISEGLYQALSAGVPRNNVFEFLEVAQQAAIGGATDTVVAVDGLTTATNAFAASGLTAQEASDIMFRTVARGKTTLEELSGSMARVAPLVAGAGVEFDEFQAVVGTMTLSGTQTAEAMTQIRAALTGLLRPSEEMTDIWRQTGFASGDLAIQTLGLQGAMEVVATAVDGSTSSMIKLLGGAEAANAVLQVTGDNASRFESVFRDVANAAGATDQAFQTMQDGVGRAFGSLTAAADRLGSSGGQLASAFAVPLVEALAPALDTFADFTDSVREFLEPVIEVWGKLVKAIADNAVFRGLVATVGTAVVAFSALATAVGGSLLVFGKLFSLIFGATVFSKFRLLIAGISALGGGFTSITGAAAKAGTAFSMFGSNIAAGRIASGVTDMGRLDSATLTLGNSISRTGTRFASASSKIGGLITRVFQPGPFLAITAALTAGVFAWNKWQQAQERARESVKVTTGLADKLADSLGLTVKELTALDRFEGGIKFDFQAENQDLIKELRRSVEQFGTSAGQELLYNIGFRFQEMGNTTEDIERVLKAVAESANIPINFDIEEGFTSDQVFDNLIGRIGDVGEELEQIFGSKTKAGGKVNAALRGRLQAIGEEIAMLGPTSVEGVAALQAVEDALNGLGPAGAAQRNIFFDDLVQFLEDTSGNKFGVSLDNMYNLATFMREMQNAGFEFEPEVPASWNAAWVEVLEGTKQTTLTSGDYWDQWQVDLDQSLTDAGYSLRTWNDLMAERTRLDEELTSRSAAAFQNARGDIMEFQQEVYDGFYDQLPLLGQYGGKVEQTFDEWLTAQNSFQADFATWTEASADILTGLPTEVANRLRAAPLSEKVWLASLGPENQARAIQEIVDSFNLVSAGAEEEFQRQLPAEIAAAESLIAEEYSGMEQDAAEAGLNVAAAWRTEFSRHAALWDDTVAFYAGQAVTTMENKFGIRSPSSVAKGMADNIANTFADTMRQHAESGTFELGYKPATGSSGGGPVSVTVVNPVERSIEDGTRKALATATLLQTMRRPI